MNDASASHFARVTPIVGDTLREMRVAVLGLARAAPLVHYLAACGVRQWIIDEPDPALVATLQARHGPALNLALHHIHPSQWSAALSDDQPDLVIAMGAFETMQPVLATAQSLQIPLLLGAGPTTTQPCRALTVFPGERFAWSPVEAPLDGWSWWVAAPLIAGLARAMLLRHTPYCRDDLKRLWDQGMRTFTFGLPDDPCAIQVAPGELGDGAAASGRSFSTPAQRRGTLLIAGLGSLGSVAAEWLHDRVSGMVLADPDVVDTFNPVRQSYDLASIGQPKATALRERLTRLDPALALVAIPAALNDEATISKLIAEQHITAGLIVTGTEADFPLARAFRAANLPHVIGRCYGRARYWEAIIVDGQHGPALSDLRGHLRSGPAAPLTPEQRAAYSTMGTLEAEPATLIESGWAAVWMARLVAQMIAPPGLRERWLLDLLAAEATCLIGGVGSEPTAHGPAYAIQLPGQIHAWKNEEIRM